MKETELNVRHQTELSVQQKKQVEHELIGKILPHQGHTMWEVNNETLEIQKVRYSNVTYVFGEPNRPEIIIREGYTYIAALNKKNALKKFKQGKSGGRTISNNPIKLF